MKYNTLASLHDTLLTRRNNSMRVLFLEQVAL